MKKELLWLISILIFSLLITGLAFDFGNYFNEVQIQYYTSYLVVFPIILALVIFFFITYISFGPSIIKSKTKIVRLWIFAISNVVMIFLNSLLIKYQFILIEGYTLYPPLSALPQTLEKHYKEDQNTLIILLVILVFLLMTLFYTGYLIVKRKKLLPQLI